MALPVDKLNRDLEGEFRFRGRPVSVPFALPGDLVQFSTERTGRRGMRVRPLFIERTQASDPSVRLEAPFCPHFGVCGGCRGQHLEYSYQLELKAEPLRQEMLRRFAVASEIVPAPSVLAFRNRMDFVVEGGGIGLRPAGVHEAYVRLEACPVQSREADAVLALLRGLLSANPGAGFVRGLRVDERAAFPGPGEKMPEDEAPARAATRAVTVAASGGPLKYATVRSGSEGGMLVLTIAPERPSEDFAPYARLREELLTRLPAAWSVVECDIDPRSEVTCVPGGRVLRGRESFRAALGGQIFDVPYDAFFQPNPQAFDRVIDWVIAALAPRLAGLESISLIDLYCGVGALSAAICSGLPPGRMRVTGFESVGSAITCAPANLAAVDPAARFVACDLNEPPQDLFGTGSDLVILDPPRAGISPALRKSLVRDCRAPMLLYVSCNPRSQLSDLEALAPAYAAQAACIVDCFPHTGHLEQAVLLTRLPE